MFKEHCLVNVLVLGRDILKLIGEVKVCQQSLARTHKVSRIVDGVMSHPTCQTGSSALCQLVSQRAQHSSHLL